MNRNSLLKQAGRSVEKNDKLLYKFLFSLIMTFVSQTALTGQSPCEMNCPGGSTFFGNTTGSETTGFSNSFFGANAGLLNTEGWENSFFGREAGFSNTAGTENTALGYRAGFNLTTGSNNVMLGAGAGPTTALGDSNFRLYIDFNTENTGNDEPLIYGEFDNDFVRINGTFEVTAGLTNPSSIKLKEAFTKVSPSLVLDKINALDITEWSYKVDPDVRHIGPTAESFYEAFGLGTGGSNISTIDADGVSLIAIQALSEQLEKKNQKIAGLEKRLERLEAMLLDQESPINE